MWEIHLRRQVKFIFLRCGRDSARFCEMFWILRDSAKNAESSAIFSSLRGARSEASATKQFAELNKETSASPCFASEAKQPSKSKLNSCEAPKSRPLRGAKNREQTSSSASADFLLEAD
ncbi:hypothetical protein [Helicobacter sp. 23-1045]